MAAPSPFPQRGPILLLGLVGVAIVVGVVAVMVAAAAPAAPRPQAGQLEIDLPSYVWGVLFLSPLIAMFAVVIGRRLTEPSARRSSWDALAVVAILMVAILLAAVLSSGTHNQGTVSITGSGPPNPPGGTSGGPGQNQTNTSGSLNGTSVAPVVVESINAWMLLAIVVAIAAGVVLLSVPGLIRGRRGFGPDRADRVPRAEVESALAEAAAAIDRGEDARETVVRLYVRLLEHLVPRVGDVSALTAEEIQEKALVGLGASLAASAALTRLFEEARYSTHDFASSDAGRFRDAIAQVEGDLLRSAAS